MWDSGYQPIGTTTFGYEKIVGATRQLAAAQFITSSTGCSDSTTAAGDGLAACQRNRSFAAEAAAASFLCFVCCRTEVGCLGYVHCV
jgi:hypothetical protein